MARARKRSDALNNKRKRIKRAIASVNKSLQKQSKEQQIASRNYVAYLQAQLKNTYVGRIQNSTLRNEAFQRASENLNRMTAQLPTARSKKQRQLQRRNSIFMNEMNLATSSSNTSLGKFGREKVKIFYRATQKLWQKQGIAPGQRLNAVMDALGTSDLKQTFEQVLKDQKLAVDYMMKHSGDMTENSEDLQEGDQYNEGGSPVYIHAVTLISLD